MKANIQRLLHETHLGGILSAPFIYALIFPFLLIDVFVTVYQHICFRLWGLQTVERSRHVILDRQDLAHLTWRERLNCAYCDYAQGVLAYVSAVTSATEHFWCPVKHKSNHHGQAGAYESYLPHDDTADYTKRLWTERKKCRACKSQHGCDKK